MLPGVGTDIVAPIRELLLRAPSGEDYFPQGGVIDGSKSRDPDNPTRVDILRAGLAMGKITATNKWAPSILGVTSAALTSVATNIVFGNAAQGTEIVRRIGATGTFKITGPATASGTVRTLTATFSSIGAGTGQDEVQTVAWSAAPTAGTFTLTLTKYDGTIVTTAAIAYSATVSTTVANAIIAVLGTSAVSCTASASTTADNGFYITFSGTNYTKVNQDPVVVNLDGITAPAGVYATVTETTKGVPAAGTGTITALGVNEVQLVTMNIASTAGNIALRYTDPTTGGDRNVSAAAWSATDATYLSNIQTQLDLATGVANGIVVTATPAVDTDLQLVFTFSGTGFAGLPHNLIQVTTLPTSSTQATVTRVTAGVDGRFVKGSLIQPTDGSETIRTLFGDKYGKSTLNALLQSVDVQFPDILTTAVVRTAVMINYPADASLKTWVKNALRTYGGHWLFDDDFFGASV
jgi:hypothetical protein